MSYFCSTMHRLRDTSYFNLGDLEMTLKGHVTSHVTYFAQIWSTYAAYTQRGPKWAYFCSTMHRLRDTSYFNIGDLEMTLKGHTRLHVT